MALKGGSFALVVTLGLVAAPSSAEAPLSVIDWLSNSVTPPGPGASVLPDVPAAAPQDIAVLPLDAPMLDSIGLIAPDRLGISPDAFGKSAAGDLARELSFVTLGPRTPASLQRFLADLLKAQITPPIDAAIDDRYFYARVDRLLTMGRLQAASDLLDLAGLDAPERFRRYFDVALLTGTENSACQFIEETPELSATYPTRIFCLARLGQFDVAALTLGNAETLGLLSETEDKLLLRFLDPELFAEDDLPPPPAQPTPLMFRLFEAVGERIATDALPVAFATADFSQTVGWKTRLRAAERLTGAGALTFDDMLTVFSERAPAASGGEWERVRALQALQSAIAGEDGAAIAKALGPARAAAKEGGYQEPFARWVLPVLGQVAPEAPNGHLAFALALLAGDPQTAERFADGSAEDAFLLRLARGSKEYAPPTDALGRAALRGLSAVNAGPGYRALLREDRRGEVLFRALGALADGASGNPDTTAHALAALVQLGLPDLARQIAVELVLMEGEP